MTCKAPTVKKLVLLIVLISMVFANNVFAEEKGDFKNHELRLGYGSPSFYWFGYEFGGMIFRAFVPFLGTTDEKQAAYIGPISVSYEYHINPLFSFGAIAAYENVWSKGNLINGKSVIGDYEQRLHFISLMAKAQIQYGIKAVKLYHALYAGGMVVVHNAQETRSDTGITTKSSNAGPAFNFHVTAIGIKVGSPEVQFFADIGIGSLGMINAGLAFTF